MDDFCACLKRFTEWVNRCPAPPIVFAESDLNGPIGTRPQPLLELLLVTQQQVHLEAGSQRAQVPAGTLVLLNAHHGNRDLPPRSDYRYCCVSLDISAAPELATLARHPLLLPAKLHEDTEVLGLYRKVTHRHHAPDPHLPAICSKSALLDLLATAYRAALTAPGPSRSRRDDVEQLLELIHIHRDDPDIDLSALVAQVPLSRDHLGRMFTKRLGLSPIQYLIRIRMRRALSLLRYTDLSIKEVAYAVGYRDSGYFARHFRREHGRAATAFRSDA